MLSRGVTHDGYISSTIVRISPFNTPDPSRRYVAMKAYYDGSGKRDRDSRVLALGGIGGEAVAWETFHPKWQNVLLENGIAYWHSTDAMLVRGYYETVPGWNGARATATLDSLLNVIVGCASSRLKSPQKLRTVAAVVYLDDYNQALSEIPSLRPPEAICVNKCVAPFVRDPDVQPASVLLYFDQNERFLRQMYNVWKKGLKYVHTQQREWATKIAVACELDSRQFVELQAADLIVWLTNKVHSLQLQVGDSDDVNGYIKWMRSQLARLLFETSAEYSVMNHWRICLDHNEEYEAHRKQMHDDAFGGKKRRAPRQQDNP